MGIEYLFGAFVSGTGGQIAAGSVKIRTDGIVTVLNIFGQNFSHGIITAPFCNMAVVTGYKNALVTAQLLLLKNPHYIFSHQRVSQSAALSG